MAEAQQRTTSQAFADWIAFQRIEPTGWAVDNERMGVIVSNIVNAIYATIPVPEGKPRAKQLQPSDFYLVTKSQASDLTPAQVEYLRRKRGGKRRDGNS